MLSLQAVLAAVAYRLAAARRDEPAGEELAEQDETSAPIVIVGFGRVGQILELRDVPCVAVDNEAGIVKRERSAGRSVFYGDARQPDVLTSLGVCEADMVIVTMDDFKATEQVVSSLHRLFPQLPVLARGQDQQRCRQLLVKGAQLAVSENLEQPSA